MSIYAHQSSNTRRTWILFAAFLIFIIGVGWIFAQAFGNGVFLYIAVGLSLAMNFVSYWYSDKIVLKISGARPVKKEDAPEFYRVTENLAIVAGLPMPKLYIIDQAAPNAFATGRDARHAAVAVTRGLLARLDRTELEGVIAHELSHIGNRDILLSTVVVVLVGIVAMLSDIFLRMSFFGGMRGRDRDGGGAIFLILGLIAAILAPFAAMVIQLAISRRREFLADASGALLTRYPEGLANALEKISADPTPLPTAGNATAHLYIASPLKGGRETGWIAKLFMTHPPIEERVKALRGMNQ